VWYLPSVGRHAIMTQWAVSTEPHQLCGRGVNLSEMPTIESSEGQAGPTAITRGDAG